jgi:hypothetical protein
VNQQREQQRMRQSPVLRVHALAVSASLEPVELNLAAIAALAMLLAWGRMAPCPLCLST